MKKLEIKPIYFELDNIKPNNFLKNKIFNEIVGVKSVGEYQYNNKNFIYRDYKNILKVEKIHIEKFVNLLSNKLYDMRGVGITVIKSQYGRFSVECKSNEIVRFKSKEYSNYLEPFVEAYTALAA